MESYFDLLVRGFDRTPEQRAYWNSVRSARDRTIIVEIGFPAISPGGSAMPESNGYDGDELQRYLDAIAREDDELDRLKGEHMSACKGPRGRIKDTKKAAREAGINMTAFNTVLAKYRDDRAQERRVAELEPDDADAYELMREALGEFGETELGQAALRKAKPRQDGDDALSSL
jgi:hypothetical protein